MVRGRKASVRYFASKRGFFGQVNGSPVRLVSCDADDSPAGPNFMSAVKKWVSLTEIHQGKGTSEYTLRALANSYRLWLISEGRKETARQFGQVESFIDQYGGHAVSALKPYMWADWIGAKTWKANTIRSVADHFQAGLNWGVRQGLIPSNPFAGRIVNPKQEGRGRESLLPGDLMDIMVDVARGEYADILRVMRGTGCRPEEIECAEVQHYANGRITFRWNASSGYIHKQAARGKKVDRVIFLSDALREIVERRIGERREGPIFRARKGIAYTGYSRQYAFQRGVLQHPLVVAYCREHGIETRGIVPYHFRHTYMSTMLDKGMPIKLLADMCGTSVAMIEQTYGKTDSDNLHEVYRKYQ